jgi:hypothetical protein
VLDESSSVRSAVLKPVFSTALTFPELIAAVALPGETAGEELICQADSAVRGESW